LVEKKKKTLRKRIWRKFQQKVGPAVAPVLGSALIRAISLTMKKEVVGLGPLLDAIENGRHVILAFWHGRMLMLPPFYERYIPWEIHVLISLHADGEIISRAIENFGLPSVRGSSRRGGKAAVVNLFRLLKQGVAVGITPDGPRGPGEVAKKGVIDIAHKTKAVIFPVSYAASRQKKLNTWDKFVIPYPFTRVVYVVGDPLEVKGTETKEEKEQLRVEIERRITETGEKADRFARYGLS